MSLSTAPKIIWFPQANAYFLLDVIKVNVFKQVASPCCFLLRVDAYEGEGEKIHNRHFIENPSNLPTNSKPFKRQSSLLLG
jgi:hypothetical protein